MLSIFRWRECWMEILMGISSSNPISPCSRWLRLSWEWRKGDNLTVSIESSKSIERFSSSFSFSCSFSWIEQQKIDPDEKQQIKYDSEWVFMWNIERMFPCWFLRVSIHSQSFTIIHNHSFTIIHSQSFIHYHSLSFTIIHNQVRDHNQSITYIRLNDKSITPNFSHFWISQHCISLAFTRK